MSTLAAWDMMHVPVSPVSTPSRKSARRRAAAPATAPDPAPAPRLRTWQDAALGAGVVSLAVLLAYSNTFDASFHFDDFRQIVHNEQIRDLRRLWPPSGARWVGLVSLALNYRAGGLDVLGYHVANVLVHLCSALLVAWIAALTLGTPVVRSRDADAGSPVRRYLPLAAGLLFAVHPLATQAVTYVVQRFTSLATLFYLLSVAAYVAARLRLDDAGSSRARGAALYAVSLASAAAAMRTKEIAFTLPLAAAAYDLLFLRRGRGRLLLVPLAAIALLVPLGLTPGRGMASAYDASHLPAETDEISRWTYLLTQSRVVVTYLRLVVLPIGQNLDHDVRLSTSLADPEVWAALAILLAVAAGAVLLLVRARAANRAAGALVFFGVAWFFLGLSVESTIVPIRDVIYEHRTYLPCAGAAIALATALLRAAERVRLPAAVALLAVAGPLAGATWARNRVWRDDVALWSDAAEKSPGKSRPHFNLGLAYRRAGRLDDAIREYREAVRLDPARPLVHNDLALAYVAAGRNEDAIREYEHAIRSFPLDRDLHGNLGVLYQADARLDDAIREYREAIRLDPGYALGRRNLGSALAAQGRTDEAIRELREAVRIDPSHEEARAALARLVELQRRSPATAR